VTGVQTCALPIWGMNIVFVIDGSKGPEESLELLKELGMPFGRE